MASRGFLPSKDAELLAWSLNFKTLITATPTTFGLTAGLATSYGTLHDDYAAALEANDPGVRSRATVAAKNAARLALTNDAKLLASIVEGQASVTDAQKLELGLNVRATPTPIPPPTTKPAIEVLSVAGRIVTLRLRDTASTGPRGKPAGVIDASVFSYVGNAPPADIGDWKFEGNCGRTKVLVEFPGTVAGGAQVFFTAFWFNGRKQSGPACDPVSTHLQGGSVSLAA